MIFTISVKFNNWKLRYKTIKLVVKLKNKLYICPMETLTKREEEIMQIFWNVKEAFVKDIISKLPEPKPPYNTISSVVRILEKKGFVAFRSFGKSHQYFPVVEKKAYRKHAFKTLMKGYFEGSYKNVISYLVNDEDLSENDIEEISKLQEILKKKDSRGGA